MEIKGELRKMPVELDQNEEVNYKLLFYSSETGEKKSISVNELVGKSIQFSFEGIILCKKCGKRTKSSFNQGFCYPCFKNAPESAECIIKPELCEAHLGKGRDPEWEERNHNQPHIVYLAATDVVKVGVTRETQIPTRWIDQGASMAIQLAQTPNRYLAGVIEVALKDQFTDRTNWRKMLKNEVDDSIDLEETKWELEEILPDDIAQYITEDSEVTNFQYPVNEYPVKVKSLSLDKQPEIEGQLMGIKGQYFLFDDNRVMNIRKHTSYQVTFQWEE
jgi:hypothetical protein